jgi:hypothetical protein
MIRQTKIDKAKKLRKEGYSYGLIKEKTGISKGMLSYHLSDMPFTPNQETLDRINNACFKSGMAKHRKKKRSIKKAHKEAEEEIGELSKRDLLMIGIGLYLGDGAKGSEHSRIINSNPDIIRLGASWFRECCNAKTKNFSVTIHIYPDINEKEALKYWSDISGVPIEQFQKTQIDRRQNKKIKKSRKLPYGTCHLGIKACNNPDLGVKLHRKIMGWIKVILDQI